MEPLKHASDFHSLLDIVYTKDAIVSANGSVEYCGQDFHFQLHREERTGFDISSYTRIKPCHATTDFDVTNCWSIPSAGSCIILHNASNVAMEYKVSQLGENRFYLSFVREISIEGEAQISTPLIKQIDASLDVGTFLLMVLENLPSDIGVFDLEHRYIYLNPQAIQKKELREFIIGKTDFDYCAYKGIDDTLAHVRERIFQEVIRTGKASGWEDEHVQPDGRVKTVLRQFSPIFDDRKELVALLGYGVDITAVKNAQHLAQINEERYRSLFEQNMAGVFRTSETGEIIDANQAYLQIFGFNTIQELQQYNSIDFYPSPEVRNQYLNELKSKGSLKNYLILNKKLDGTWIQLLANVTYRQIGETNYIEGTLIDITALQEATNQLREQKESLEQLAFFLDQTSDAVQVADEDGHFVFLNRTARERLGIREDEMDAYSVLDIQHYFTSVDDWKRHIPELEKAGELRMETTHRNVKTGEETPVEISVIPRNFHGKTYVISTVRDITERITAQRTIEERNKFVNDLTSVVNASSLVSVADLSGKITSVNKNFCAISGYTEEELIGSNHSIVNSGYHTKEFWADMYKSLFSGETWQGEIRNRTKDGSLYWVSTVIYPIKDEQGKPIQFMSIRQEITAAKENESIIQKQINFQELVIRTSSKLINLNPERLEDAINTALKDIGEFVDADRAYIFDYNLDKETTSNLYEWCREGVDPQIDALQNIPFSDVPKWIETHFRGEIMDIPSVAELPNDQFKELMEVQDIKSLIALPMMDGNICTGFIGFDSVREVHTFNETDKIILELFAEMIVNINKRIHFIQEIELANKRYIEINEGLEKIIAEKTAKNNELTQNMANQDKLAMIGEITAGITHDLNTPIGAIKVGAESIHFTLRNLFNQVLEKCTAEQLHLACSLDVSSNTQMFIGGLQTMRETQTMLTYLGEQYPEIEQKDEMAAALVKARIQTNQASIIEKIVHSPNSLAFIDLIYHIQSTRTFVNTVLEAGEKAASVIKNLRFYLKEGGVHQKAPVRLHDNIKTVLNVFNHQLKHGIDLTFDVPEELMVVGYETKLYQLWSNLIKNAIDAMSNGGELQILGKKLGREVVVSIRNSGTPIPEEIREQIFEKFFTTKADKNGTGLGLSIVKKVVEEHHAKIKLESDNSFTSFIVTFED
jgi:PAS domain S-box-containing protein